MCATVSDPRSPASLFAVKHMSYESTCRIEPISGTSLAGLINAWHDHTTHITFLVLLLFATIFLWCRCRPRGRRLGILGRFLGLVFLLASCAPLVGTRH